MTVRLPKLRVARPHYFRIIGRATVATELVEWQPLTLGACENRINGLLSNNNSLPKGARIQSGSENYVM